MTAETRVLWYHSWLQTQAYFILGTLILVGMAFALFMSYPGEPAKEFPHGAIALGVEQVRALPADLRSYVWLHWFGNTLILWWPFLALALAGTGLPRDSKYLLTLPVSRRTVMKVRIAVGIIELTAATLLSTLFVVALSLFVKPHFRLTEALVHAGLMIVGGAGLYGLFVFLSATVGDLHKALLGVAFISLYGMFSFMIEGFRRYSILRLMIGDDYFLHGQIPWAGLGISAAAAVVLISASVRIVECREY